MYEQCLNFEVYTRTDPDVLILIDTSDLFEFPSNAIVEVEFPNFEGKSYGTFYNVDKPTILTTKLLGFSPNRIDFPDGLYSIRISVAPNKTVFKHKYYLKLDKTYRRVSELLENNTLEEVEDFVVQLDKDITLAQYTAPIDPKKSIEFFNAVTRKLERFKCN